MSPEDILEACSEKKLIIQKGQVFFNERNVDEVQRFRKLGCEIVPWYDEDQLKLRKARGRPTAQGYEVHLLGACDPIWEPDEDGDEVEITRAVLLSRARERG